MVALACALAAAKGPARHQSATVEWPGQTPPAPSATGTGRANPTGEAGVELWYTPLLLSSHEAVSLDVSWPCELRATQQRLLFGSAVPQDGLYSAKLNLSATQLTIDVGEEPLVNVPWPPATRLRTGTVYDARQRLGTPV